MGTSSSALLFKCQLGHGHQAGVLLSLSLSLSLLPSAYLSKLKPSDERLGFVERICSAPCGLPTLRSWLLGCSGHILPCAGVTLCREGDSHTVGGAFEISADDFLGRLAVVRVVGAGYITEYLHNHHILNTLNTRLGGGHRGMATPGTQPRSSRREGRPQSLFYKDLSASPATRTFRKDHGTPGQAAAAAALWRENLGGSDPPPPPMYTLEDRIERSVDASSGADPTFQSPESAKYRDGRSPFGISSSAQGGYNYTYGDSTPGHALPSASPPTPPQTQSSGSPIWWSSVRDRSAQESMPGRSGEREGGSPVAGVVQPQQQPPGGLLALQPPRDVVRPELPQASGAANTAEGDEWVTVFGFGAGETNTVMREFEKCGPIVNHVSGPGGANWVHIQYQNSYDAKKALLKDGMLLNNSLIVGVKPLDPVQRQAFAERLEQSGSMTTAPRMSSWGTGSVQASQRSYYVQRTDNGPRSTVLATPAKSTLSKFVDLVFGS